MFYIFNLANWASISESDNFDFDLLVCGPTSPLTSGAFANFSIKK